MNQGGTYTGNYIIKQEFFRSPHLFQHRAEHPQSKHIEEDMRKTAMHEHVGNELVRLKLRRCKIMQAKHICKVNIHRTFQHNSGQVKQPVDNQ